MTAAASPISGFCRLMVARPSSSPTSQNPRFMASSGLPTASASPSPAAPWSKTSSSSKPALAGNHDKHLQSASFRLRYASSAVHDHYRQVRALRLLFAGLPHVRALERGNGFAAVHALVDN